MKYFSKTQILESLRQLENLNPFFGLTFLSAKSANLPIGKSTELGLDSFNNMFLEKYFSLDPRSIFFFRVFRYNHKDKYWLNPDYSGKGLQKLNTTTFKDAFIHEHDTNKWGWRKGYVDFLSSKLAKGLKIPALHLAVWLFRAQSWEEKNTRKKITSHFFSKFNITLDEREKIFSEKVESQLTEKDAFQEFPVSWQEISQEFELPPDFEPERGGILSLLEMENVGPVSPLIFEPGNSLNIITGDNGLGKTFLLEVIWYVLTGKWAGEPALPNKRIDSEPKGKIKFKISGMSTGKPQSISYDGKINKWPEPTDRATISGLVIYARVDGSYAVWDPIGNSIKQEKNEKPFFHRDKVWDGETGRIEGLIRDWTRWQDNPKKYPFDTFLKVLKCMAPPEMGNLKPGEAVRIPFEHREIPTIKHNYGDVPIIHESAGIRHIITLAYLMVWAWNEHRILAKQVGRKLENRMVVMVDEMEVHLHPRWQRAILPALLKVAKILSSKLEMQLIIATHSPLVLASAEPIFDESSDKLFHLDITKRGKVSFEETPFIQYGQINSWLTSDIFALKQPRSVEAEKIISMAIAIQLQDRPDVEAIKKISEKLAEVLPAEDSFWPRWVFFAEDHGVDL